MEIPSQTAFIDQKQHNTIDETNKSALISYYLQDALHAVSLDAAAVDGKAVLHRGELVVRAVLPHLQRACEMRFVNGECVE